MDCTWTQAYGVDNKRKIWIGVGLQTSFVNLENEIEEDEPTHHQSVPVSGSVAVGGLPQSVHEHGREILSTVAAVLCMEETRVAADAAHAIGPAMAVGGYNDRSCGRRRHHHHGGLTVVTVVAVDSFGAKIWPTWHSLLVPQLRTPPPSPAFRGFRWRLQRRLRLWDCKRCAAGTYAGCIAMGAGKLQTELGAGTEQQSRDSGGIQPKMTVE